MYASAVTSRISAVRAGTIRDERKPSLKKSDCKITKALDPFESLSKVNNFKFETLQLSTIAENLKGICTEPSIIRKLVDIIHEYSTNNKINTHDGAILCTYLKDIYLPELSFQTALLEKIQACYDIRNQNYNQLDSFLQQVAFLCEVYHHLKMDTSEQYECLALTMYNYFIMLLTSGSEKEVITFCEHFLKCYKKMKCDYVEEFHQLLLRMRKLVVSESSSVVSRSLLLQTLEKLFTNEVPLTSKAQTFYQIFAKPNSSICH